MADHTIAAVPDCQTVQAQSTHVTAVSPADDHDICFIGMNSFQYMDPAHVQACPWPTPFRPQNCPYTRVDLDPIQ